MDIIDQSERLRNAFDVFFKRQLKTNWAKEYVQCSQAKIVVAPYRDQDNNIYRCGIERIGELNHTIEVKCSPRCSSLSVGDIVWVIVLYNNWRNAFVWQKWDFSTDTSGGGGGEYITREDLELALADYLPKQTSEAGTFAYIFTGEAQGAIPISDSASPNAIAEYDNGGRLKTENPFTGKDCVNKDYADATYASLSYASTLYARINSLTEAELLPSKPTSSSSNIMLSSTTNTDYIWTQPDFVFRRTTDITVVMSATSGYTVSLAFRLNRSENISFGARLKVSTDNGSTWEYISTNQSFGAQDYSAEAGNTAVFTVYSNALTAVTEYAVGTIFAVEIFKKQSTATTLNTSVYCGVDVDNAIVYTTAIYNIANVNIDTSQIADGSVTIDKLSSALQAMLEDFVTLSTVQEITATKTFARINGKTLYLRNADSSSTPTYPTIGFYLYGAQVQLNARKSDGTLAHQLMLISTTNKSVAFYGGVSAPSFTENGVSLANKYLALTGGTLTGVITLPAGSDAHAEAAIYFGEDNARIGCSSNLAFYCNGGKIILRPNYTSSSSNGVEINASSFIPSRNNYMSLGNASHYFTKIYVKDIDLDGSQVAKKTDIPVSVDGMSGGTISSAVTVTGNITGRYLISTWLQTTAATETATYDAIFVNNGGWLYKRTPAGFIADHGLAKLNDSAQTGTFYATTIYASSDRRLKDRIKPCDIDFLDIVRRIGIKEFVFIKDESKTIQIGAIAQELRSIMPKKYKNGLVHGDEENGGYLSVNNGELAYIAIGALQEEARKREEAEQKVKRLEAKVSSLEKRIARLEALITGGEYAVLPKDKR